ncbi:MAG TPA: hypothetical protein VLO11_08430, partial [Luteolibacter sp.]|nr:hypothetical protein [Luteolibacter sp.]
TQILFAIRRLAAASQILIPMTLAALQHLIRAAAALAEDRRFLVLGSASLLSSFPELGEASAPLASTYDADLLPEPFDELTPRVLANYKHTLAIEDS